VPPEAGTRDPGRDWADRTLCDDGSCTGLIGGDGLCKVCGKLSRFWGDERRRGMQDDPDDDDGLDVASPVDQGPGDVDVDRSLCVDGSCIGLVGDDGHCKACGLSGPKPGARAVVVVTTDAVLDPDAVVDGGTVTVDGERALCPDGSCTGVIDDTGVCSECGRPAAEL